MPSGVGRTAQATVFKQAQPGRHGCAGRAVGRSRWTNGKAHVSGRVARRRRSESGRSSMVPFARCEEGRAAGPTARWNLKERSRHAHLPNGSDRADRSGRCGQRRRGRVGARILLHRRREGAVHGRPCVAQVGAERVAEPAFERPQQRRTDRRTVRLADAVAGVAMAESMDGRQQRSRCWRPSTAALIIASSRSPCVSRSLLNSARSDGPSANSREPQSASSPGPRSRGRPSAYGRAGV